MPEVVIDDDVLQRVNDFRGVFAEVTETELSEVDFKLTANAILVLGLDYMMAEFFGRLDEDTLEKSARLFYERHPNCKPIERANVTSNELAGVHVALSRCYPKQFFPFMLEVLTWEKCAKARERFEQLFRRWDSERNGHG